MDTVDIAIVGAGWCGLYAAKYAKAQGLTVRVLEARPEFGGVWRYSDDRQIVTVMAETVSSSSRHVTEASDFGMSPGAGNFFSHRDAIDYLQSYVDKFGLAPLIRYGFKVVRTEKSDDLWTVHAEDGTSVRCRHLCICAGVHQQPRPITGPVAAFSGTTLHSAGIKSHADLDFGAEATVIVYGGGETASDIVDLLARTDAKIVWAIKDGQHFFRKTPFRAGLAPGAYDRNDNALDLQSTIVHTTLTDFVKSKPGMRYGCNIASSNSVLSFQGHGVAAWINDIPWYRQFFNKNGHALDHVWNGRVQPVAGVSACDGNLVAFESGERIAATHIICCFGYQTDFSFLPEDMRQTPTHMLYEFVFHPDDPSLSFIGYARPIITSLPFMAEVQCMFAADYWSGRKAFPDRAHMEGSAREHDAELDELFLHRRSNKNLVHPASYVRRLMKSMGMGRIYVSPLRQPLLFGRLLRAPFSPLWLRFFTAAHTAEDARRLEEYCAPQIIKRRKAGVSLLSMIARCTFLIGGARLIKLDDKIDRKARHRLVSGDKKMLTKADESPVEAAISAVFRWVAP